MQRVWALVERELRRFRRSPMLIIVSMIFPMVQLVVLGYAFGGNVKHLKLAVVDQDGGLQAVKLRELFGAVTANAATFETLNYNDPGEAMNAWRQALHQALYDDALAADLPIFPIHDLPLLGLRRVADLHHQHEAVDLRLGQRVGALLLDRVLRREDEKRALEPEACLLYTSPSPRD